MYSFLRVADPVSYGGTATITPKYLRYEFSQSLITTHNPRRPADTTGSSIGPNIMVKRKISARNELSTARRHHARRVTNTVTV